VTAVENTNTAAPEEFALFQNYPNPFNPTTKIQYSLAKASQVSLIVYNAIGVEVATLVSGHQEAGNYTVPFGATTATAGLSSGMYFYRLEAGSFVSMKKFTLIK
jgi:hemolysin activation/secretion protein